MLDFLGTAIAVVIVVWVMARFHRMRNGLFNVETERPGAFAFRTDLGHFALDLEKGAFSATHGDKTESVPLAAVTGIEVLNHETFAKLEELLDLSPLSLFPRYRDAICWYTI